jgi:N-acetyltransferase
VFPPKTWKGRPFQDVPTLSGRFVRLEPLDLRHAEDLYRAGSDPEIWSYLAEPRGPFLSSLDAVRWVEHVLKEKAGGIRLPFAVTIASSGETIGSTSFFPETRWDNRTLEIGGTWLGRRHWRTAVNTECKHLLLGHAFDSLGADRIEFLTDARNERSQRALERLGARREGTLREHMLCADGHLRTSICFSILAREWPAIRHNLDKALTPRGQSK